MLQIQSTIVGKRRFILCESTQIFYHSQPSPEYEIEPDDRDANQSFSSIISVATGFVKRIFKGVASTPSIVEPCMYTVISLSLSLV